MAARHAVPPIRLQIGDHESPPKICGSCAAPNPTHWLPTTHRRIAIVNGRPGERTVSVNIGYCDRCFARLRRRSPLIERVWTSAALASAATLLAQLAIPRTEMLLPLRDLLPFVAAAIVLLAGLFHLWARSLDRARLPVRLVGFGLHHFVIAIDNPTVAQHFQRAAQTRAKPATD